MSLVTCRILAPLPRRVRGVGPAGSAVGIRCSDFDSKWIHLIPGQFFDSGYYSITIRHPIATVVHCANVALSYDLSICCANNVSCGSKLR